MSSNNLELSSKDNILHLDFWDSLHGDDVLLEIHIGGRVFRSLGDGDEKVLGPTNLIYELRKLADRFERQRVEAIGRDIANGQKQ